MRSIVWGNNLRAKKAEQHVPLAVRLMPRVRQTSGGFTLFEMLLVLFLLALLLVVILPRTGLANNLPSACRQLIATIRSLQAMASSSQKTVRLYLDLDQRSYWAMLLEEKEERPPLEASLASRMVLPSEIRFLEVVTVQHGKVESGRAFLHLFPTGRVDPSVIYLTDLENNVLAIRVLPLTGRIQVSDQRIEDQRMQPIPDRLRSLLPPFMASVAER